jgi:gamma-glutamylcyclotransferase (GGCT)/AIG2-like uncharacterized protein YtfP
MKRIFCYGTLQEPSVQLELIGRTVDGALTSIEGFIVLRDYIDIDDGIAYPRIVEYPNGCVYGRILEFTDEEVVILDEYETEMYYLAEVTTKDNDVAWIYMPTI